MIVYLDSGVFIDYLIDRSHADNYLRTSHRRGRNVTQLSSDADLCFSKLINKRHQGITSTLTFFEVENTLYESMSNSSHGISHANNLLIPSARAIMVQMLMTIKQFDIKLLDLTEDILTNHVANLNLQLNAIRVGDSLHIATAIENNVDAILSTDQGILNLDKKITNKNGGSINCWDTDVAAQQM